MGTLLPDAVLMTPFLERPEFRTTIDGAAGAAPDHSETNTQVVGVDEADLVETDGQYLYILSGQELVIADSGISLTEDNAWTIGEFGVVSRVEIEGQPFGQYLSGDRLTVISYAQGPYYGIARTAPSWVSPSTRRFTQNGITSHRSP